MYRAGKRIIIIFCSNNVAVSRFFIFIHTPLEAVLRGILIQVAVNRTTYIS